MASTVSPAAPCQALGLVRACARAATVRAAVSLRLLSENCSGAEPTPLARACPRAPSCLGRRCRCCATAS